MSSTADLFLDRPELSPREAEVALLAAAGLQTKQVASRLGISFHTARHHMEHAYAKLGVRSRVALANAVLNHAAYLTSGGGAGEERA